LFSRRSAIQATVASVSSANQRIQRLRRSGTGYFPLSQCRTDLSDTPNRRASHSPGMPRCSRIVLNSAAVSIVFSFTKGKKGGRPATAPTSPSHSSTPGDRGVGVAVCDLPGAGSFPAVLGEHGFGGGQRLVDDVVGVRGHGDRPSGDLATEGVEGLAVDLPDLLAAQHFNGAATVVGDVVGQRDRDGVVPGLVDEAEAVGLVDLGGELGGEDVVQVL